MVWLFKDKLGLELVGREHKKTRLGDALNRAWELHYASDDEQRRPRFTRASSPDSPNPFEHALEDEKVSESGPKIKLENDHRLPGLLGRFIADAGETKLPDTASPTPRQADTETTSTHMDPKRGKKRSRSGKLKPVEDCADVQRRSTSPTVPPVSSVPVTRRTKTKTECLSTRPLRRSSRIAQQTAKE